MSILLHPAASTSRRISWSAEGYAKPVLNPDLSDELIAHLWVAAFDIQRVGDADEHERSQLSNKVPQSELCAALGLAVAMGVWSSNRFLLS